MPALCSGSSAGPAPELSQPRSCYTCKRRFTVLHFFYDQLCEACARLNYVKRLQTADLAGRVAVLTGARVKIGFHTGLKLLRCGATLVASTRFPYDCSLRWATALIGRRIRKPRQFEYGDVSVRKCLPLVGRCKPS